MIMSIKKKLIMVFILFTSLAIIPLSSLLINNMERGAIIFLQNQSKIYAGILSKAVVNSLMMNGGDIQAAGVDIKDMISIFEPLKNHGLVYADAVLLSSNEKKNGTIISSLAIVPSDNISTLYSGKPDSEKIKNTLYYDGSFREFSHDQAYYEFVKSGSLPGSPPFCFVRILISKDIALADIARLKYYMFSASGFLLFLVLAVAFILGGYISSPILHLTERAKKIESGDYSRDLTITSRDEIGTLADTFNSMASMIEQKISELERANIELQTMDKLKDEFLANTSHELKTPIHGIIGLTESLLDGTCGTLNDNSRNILSMIAKSSKRLANLVNDILDFARLKNSDIILDIKNIDIRSMIDAVLTILSPLLSGKNVKILNEIEDPARFVKGDENRIEQILINIIGNAIKFTENGTITINSEAGPGNLITISVTDTGIGIPEDMHEAIFESFVQSDGSISRKYGGTGLGLAITRDLVSLHGGEIRVESEPGKGSTFFITLHEGEKSGAATYKISAEDSINRFSKELPLVSSDTGIEFSGSRILVVDDEPVNLQILINQLTKEKYSVQFLTNGEEAISAIESGAEFDLVLLDVMMPVISGFDVCKKIREKYSAHELPVVLLTAKNTKEDIIAGLTMGANDYITKPFDKEELLARVKNYISLKKAAEEQKKFIAVKQELEIARNIQLSILPGTLPQMNCLSIKAKYEPMMEVGGDFYDFLQIDEHRIGILIADVTGHGVAAALISSMVKIAFYMSHDRIDDPAALLSKINSSLFEHIYGRFITAFYIFIDTKEMKALFSNAAHWPIYIQNRHSGEISEHTIRGRLIGINREENYRNQAVNLKNGDRLILYTDGLIEERDKTGELLGEDRFVEMITENSGKPPARLIDETFMNLYNWSGSFNSGGLEDDATMIVVDID
jgi:two-component system sensor histidine kinase ChiS